MEVRELKFLLKLIALPEYKGKISELKPTSKTKIAETEQICDRLRERALVDCIERVTLFELSTAGKALLKLKVKNLPLTAIEFKLLQACRHQAITPSQTKLTPATTRDKSIDSCIKRGLITPVATKIELVWLSDRGKHYLLNEYTPQGYNSVLSLDLLNNYLGFLRDRCSFGKIDTKQFPHNLSTIDNPNITVNSHPKKTFAFTDDRVLQTIKDLDRHLNTGNYLPIFYLRDKLKPFLSREELDTILYRLQKQDKLELSSIVESSQYTKEQLMAGIPQNVGGCLFFLIVNELRYIKNLL